MSTAYRDRSPGGQSHCAGRRHAKRKDDGKGGRRGWDAAKRLNGRKRHVAVDTQGLLLGVIVRAAAIQDADGLHELLKRIKRLYPWLRVVFADSIRSFLRRGGAGGSHCRTGLKAIPARRLSSGANQEAVASPTLQL